MRAVSILICGLFFALGCQTTRENPSLGSLRSEGEYFDALDKSSRKEKVYHGLYAVMEYSASLLTNDVSRLQVDQNARIYQWNSEQYGAEKSKVENLLSAQTDVFLSFFTPETKNNDLHKPKTNWRVFLDANGRRYEGKVQRLKAQSMAETAVLYPLHNRWSTPYKITFPVPTSLIEATDAKLTLTGPVGSSSVDFKAVEKK